MRLLVNEASIVKTVILLLITELQLDKASANPGTFFVLFCLFPVLFRFNKLHGFHYLNLSLCVFDHLC